MDLSDHTECCGSECKPFHLGSCFLIHPFASPWLAVVFVDSFVNLHM